MSDGFMAKLTIIPFKDSENVQIGPPAGPPFIAQFNPESFSINNEIELGPVHADLAELAERALTKHRNRRLSVFSGSASRGDAELRRGHHVLTVGRDGQPKHGTWMPQ